VSLNRQTQGQRATSVKRMVAMDLHGASHMHLRGGIIQWQARAIAVPSNVIVDRPGTSANDLGRSPESLPQPRADGLDFVCPINR